MTQEKKQDIIHLDMDAFYPSVEILDNPELKGKPVIVGGTNARGVVSSASYEARKLGVHSAQPIITAEKLCPNGIYIRPRMSRYSEISKKIFEIFREFSPLVEPLSIDEAFLDVSGMTRLFGSPADMAVKIKETVKKRTGLTVSAGVAPSKLVAKIASDLEKPDGLTVVPHDGVLEFLRDLPIKKMWGVGKVTLKNLNFMGITTIGDITELKLDFLEKKFGKLGTHLYYMSRGMDFREVETTHAAKSMGREDTFAHDITSINKAREKLLALATQVARRLRANNLLGRTVTLKVKYDDFQSITRGQTIPVPTDDQQEIYRIAVELIKGTEIGKRPVRLLGIYLTNLGLIDDEQQIGLFEQEDRTRKSLNQAMDRITDKYGREAVKPGTLLKKPLTTKKKPD